MPEDVFRIVITVAVALACLAFVVQAGVVIALYSVIRVVKERVLPLVDQVSTITTRAVPVIDRVSPTLETAGRVLASTQKIIEDARPRVAEISTEAVAIARSGRQQVERVGALLADASEKARERLNQIDRSVDETVEQLENAGEAVKRAVTRPVREVNGLAAGISAAVSALVHGSRRPSVDHATQDEEMFI